MTLEMVIVTGPYIIAMDVSRNDHAAMVVARKVGTILIIDEITTWAPEFANSNIKFAEPLPLRKEKPYWARFDKRKWR